MKLALGIIVKDEFELVENIVDRYSQYFDEVVLAVDKDFDKFRNAFDGKVKVIEYKWINDFSHKRNFLADNIESEYYFRIDTDDEIEHPEKIREVFDNMVNSNIDVTYFPYVYSRDYDGNCDALHWRETIIRKDPKIYWKKSIHENIFAEDAKNFKGMKCQEITIIHNITEEHSRASNERNLQYLLKEFEQDKENTDPRTLSYIGRVLAGRGEFEAAIPFLELLIEKSGWADDKYFAWCHLSDCWKNLGNFEQAIGCANEALELNTTYPDAYIKKGALYLDKDQYQKALDWIMPGLVRPIPDTMFVVTPSFYTVTAKIYACIAFLGLGKFDEALRLFYEIKKASPNHEFVINREKEIIEMSRDDAYTKNLFSMVRYLGNKKDKIQSLIESIPGELLKDERVWQLRNANLPPKNWSDKSVVIFCASTPEYWAPPSVITGIGGSEEAVIYLSKELVKQGFEVTVYNQCGEMAGTYEGVTYRNYYEINLRDNFNFFISWRLNIFKDLKINAKKSILWLHDVPMGMKVEDTKHLDKILVLSEFHKTLLPEGIEKEKIFVSANGINLRDFVGSQVRNPKRMIYTSSYDRGIEHVLNAWPEIRKEVPDAELYCFYGWNTFNEMLKNGHVLPDFKSRMEKLFNQPGVFECGRVGHRQLIKELMKSSIWVYPCHFEEISCISGMKAQSCKCIPLTTDYAALKETVRSGIKIPGRAGDPKVNEQFKNELIALLKDADRQEKLRKEMDGLAEQFSWAGVAKQWADELLVCEALV